MITPIYLKILDDLRTEIASGRLPPGAQVPTEAELTRRYGVARETVRAAVSVLVRDGVVVRERQRGTRVVLRLTDEFHAPALTSLTEELEGRGITVTTRLLALRKCKPPKDVVAGLGLLDSANIVYMKRLRLADGRPIGVHSQYLSPSLTDRLPPMSAQDWSTTSFYKFVEESIGLTFVAGEQRVTAAAAGARNASLLELRADSPVLRVERKTYDRFGQPVELVDMVYRANRYYYSVLLRRK